MRILVVDDHPLMADALRLAVMTLEKGAQVECAGDLEGAFAKAEGSDLCLLDLGLPGYAGLDALVRLRETYPSLPVVVVSGASDHASILQALDLGAMGFIPKTAPREVLINAVRLVASGGIYVPVEALRHRDAPPVSSTPPSGERAGMPKRPADLGLSARQAEVLSLLLKGLPNKLIARKLDISENTTKIHVSAVLRALDVATRTQALLAANRLGLRLD
jgi:DNA-binding NarL/FixJ family response regulator